MTPNQRGILLMTLGMAGFAIEDAFIKLAAETLMPGQIMLTVGVLGTGIFAFAAHRRGHRVWSRAALHWAVMGRNVSEMVGSGAYVLALALVPLSLVSAIFQAMPLAVTMGAALFLRERVGWRRWVAILVGFGGVILIIRPGGEGFEPVTLLALVSVLGLAARDLFTRRIRAAVDTMQLTTWGFLSVALVGGGQLLVSGGAAVPNPWEALMLLGSLVAAVVSYWWLTEATRVGELSAVMPFRYTRLLFALVIGFAVFGEVPDGWTVAGSALIVASGIYAFLRERARARAEALEALSVVAPSR